MTVHKKHPANASAFVKTTADKKAMADKSTGKEKKTEPVIVSDVVTEVAERVEIIEEITPQANLEKPAESSSPANPLGAFKEKMVEEELSASNNTSNKNYMWPILIVFIVTILLLAGVFLYRQGIFLNRNKINVATISPTPTIVPEPTKAIDLTKYEIEILNGGGVSGEASRQRDNLETEGFTVSSIGNADNSDYTDTVIKAKAEVDKDFITKLKDVLNSSFTVGETETLSDESSVPVVVIIGTKK